jgi:DAACS family dicarboxylate/amino acid:cation (Na+ or H+) symporter
MAILGGVGTAGVPSGSLPIIMLILISIGIPGESIGIIYGIDRLLDMCRTVLNVTGDLTAAVFVSKSNASVHSDAVA